MAQPSVLTIADVAKASTYAFNEKNWDKVRAALTQGIVYDEIATGRKAQGVEDVVSIWRGWATALPDATATILNEYTSGTTAILELAWSGTHAGPLQTPNGTIPPTGRKINVRACQVIEVAGDKLANVRHYFDMVTLLGQIGALNSK